MSKLVPYAVHSMFDGVRRHFFKLGEQFSDVEALHSASGTRRSELNNRPKKSPA